MKSERNIKKYLLATIIAFGWWGLLYPEFTYNGDTISAFCESTGHGVKVEYDTFIKADQEQIRLECGIFHFFADLVADEM